MEKEAKSAVRYPLRRNSPKHSGRIVNSKACQGSAGPFSLIGRRAGRALGPNLLPLERSERVKNLSPLGFHPGHIRPPASPDALADQKKFTARNSSFRVAPVSSRLLRRLENSAFVRHLHLRFRRVLTFQFSLFRGVFLVEPVQRR